MLDVNGQSIGDGTLELVKFAETASAVNEITVTNSATGNAPEISATGDDTNIDLKLTPKGTGKLNLDGIKFPNADGTANQFLKTDGSGNLSFDSLSFSTPLTVIGNATAGSEIRLPEDTDNGSNYVALKAPDNLASNLTLTLPSADGTAGQVLKTNGAGVLSFTSIADYSVDFLVVAGGGGGGFSSAGGAGGYRTSTQTVKYGTAITVTVGDGGAPTANGSDSSISGLGLTTITSAGGGKGGANNANGSAGGSGGAGGASGVVTTGGAGNTPSTSPSQGNNGGNNNTGSPYPSGGGGGASAVGQNAPSSTQAGNGGNGTASSITGSSVTYAGGGGGGVYLSGGTGGTGGTGGGGNGSGTNNGSDGTANLGGGGGGGYNSFSSSGGKGVVILSMPDANYTGTTTGSPTVATGVSGKTVLTFNGSGSYTA
jgi:hypothetical protein